MTMMAMAHPRRYSSLSPVGAIAVRLPPTSSSLVRERPAGDLEEPERRVGTAIHEPLDSVALESLHGPSSSSGHQAYPTTPRQTRRRRRGLSLVKIELYPAVWIGWRPLR